MVAGEVQTVCSRLPIRNQRRNVVVDGLVWIGVDLASDPAQVPATVVVGVRELGQIHGIRGRDDEEVSHSRVVVDKPIRCLWKQDPVVTSPQNDVVLARGSRKHQTNRAVRVDMEDRHVGILGYPVVDPHALALLEDGLRSTIQPDSHFELVLLPSATGWLLGR
jgi:hypothetical protein